MNVSWGLCGSHPPCAPTLFRPEHIVGVQTVSSASRSVLCVCAGESQVCWGGRWCVERGAPPETNPRQNGIILSPAIPRPVLGSWAWVSGGLCTCVSVELGRCGHELACECVCTSFPMLRASQCALEWTQVGQVVDHTWGCCSAPAGPTFLALTLLRVAHPVYEHE